MLIETVSNVALMAQTGPIEEISEFFGVDFFSLVLPWLLTFAIVYGVLSQLGEGNGMPENKGARATIGIVLAFIIAPVLSPYAKELAGLSAGFVALIAGVLILVIFTEIAGLRKDKAGEGEFFGKYPLLTGTVLVALAVLVFVGSGAHTALGIEIPPYIAQNYPLLFFLAFMVMIVWWMVSKD